MQEVAAKLEKKAALLAGGEDNKMGQILVLRALATIYGQCHLRLHRHHLVRRQQVRPPQGEAQWGSLSPVQKRKHPQKRQCQPHRQNKRHRQHLLPRRHRLAKRQKMTRPIILMNRLPHRQTQWAFSNPARRKKTMNSQAFF